MSRPHDDLDHDLPDPDPDPDPDDLNRPAQTDFLEQFGDAYEIVTTTSIRPRGGPRRARDGAGELDAVPVPAPPRAPLPAPTTPHPDPIPLVMPHGSISTLSGASGVGKTCWLAGLIKAFQTGQPVNGHPTTMPSAIGFISVDRPYRDHQVWFARAGCAPFPYYSVREDDSVVWEHFRDHRRVPALFDAALDKLGLPPGALVIVDPLPLFIPGRLIDYKDAAIGLAMIDRALRARQLTLLGVFHVGKEKGNKNDRYLRPQDRILGSGGQVGYSETAIYLMSPVETGADYYTIGWVPHQIPEQSFKLQRDAQGLFVPYDDLDHAMAQYLDADRALACFADDTIHFTAWLLDRIKAACSCQERHARDVLAELVRDGKVEKVSRGNYRRLRPPAPDVAADGTP